MHAEPVGALWDEADVVLAVGSDLDGMMTQNWLMPPPPALIAVNVDAADAGKNYAADVTLVGDARRGARGAPAAGGAAAAIWRALDPSPAGRRRTRSQPTWRADEPQAAQLLESLDRVLPARRGACWPTCASPATGSPATAAFPGRAGCCTRSAGARSGSPFPASLGASLAGAGPVVCVCGDGGFLFACGELATLAEIRTPLTDRARRRRWLRDAALRPAPAPARTRSGSTWSRRTSSRWPLRSASAALAVDGFGAAFAEALGAAVAVGEPRMLVVRAQLKPPPTTSPRWYRRGRELH